VIARGTKSHASDHRSPTWTLHDVATRIRWRKYSLRHVEDTIAQDIEWGWKALSTCLPQPKDEYTRVLCVEWVRRAHHKFAHKIEIMQRSQWGNGRIIAVKTS
jgi:hypothetical protein